MAAAVRGVGRWVGAAGRAALLLQPRLPRRSIRESVPYWLHFHSTYLSSPVFVRSSSSLWSRSRTSQLLYTVTQEKSTGPNLEEDPHQSHSEHKPDFHSATKVLTEEKTKLEEQLKEITDKYKRALADAENLRQRTQKLVEEAKLYGVQSFCKDLLEVADVLEKATESVPKEELKDENPHLKNLYEGLAMTEVQIQKVFGKHGLVKLNPLGAKFDPYEHEALFHVPMEGKDPGTVALVSKVGYKLHGRTLRPALVGVVKEPE